MYQYTVWPHLDKLKWHFFFTFEHCLHFQGTSSRSVSSKTLRNVHTVLADGTKFAYIILSHFITFFLGQVTGAMKVYWLGVSDTSTPTFNCYWKATIFQTAKYCSLTCDHINTMLESKLVKLSYVLKISDILYSWNAVCTIHTNCGSENEIIGNLQDPTTFLLHKF